MDLTSLKARLNSEGISSRSYAIYENRDLAYCLTKTSPGTWAVFYSERGHRWDARFFASESAACDELLDDLLSDPTTRINYQGPPLPPH